MLSRSEGKHVLSLDPFFCLSDRRTLWMTRATTVGHSWASITGGRSQLATGKSTSSSPPKLVMWLWATWWWCCMEPVKFLTLLFVSQSSVIRNVYEAVQLKAASIATLAQTSACLVTCAVCNTVPGRSHINMLEIWVLQRSQTLVQWEATAWTANQGSLGCQYHS